ncbi:MAG TPA: hypothetical protein VFY38_08965 [Pseudonocardia sp.]|nr:hypothetical protein [Pseudonocardia sp.]
MAPTPGLDAVAVLREAVAARTRGKVRDAVLLALLVAFAWMNPMLAVVWVVVGVGLLVVSGRAARAGLAAAAAAAAVVLLLAIPGLQATLIMVVYELFGSSAATVFAGLGGGADTPTLLVTAVLGLSILTVLGLDEWIVTELTRGRFRSGVAIDPAGLAGLEPTVRTWGHARWRPALSRVARAGAVPTNAAEVIVHRTRHPFVGAGRVVDRRTLPLPLRPAENTTAGNKAADTARRAPQPFTAADLLAGVAETIRRLRESESLAPSARLLNVETLQQVYVSAPRLVRDRFAPAVAGLLPDLDVAPAQWIPRERASALADHPDETARLYHCYRVESWDRDLSISCLLSATTDQRTLYLEWTHCVLPPIRESYRKIDHVDDEGPMRRTVRSAVLLPATAPGRLMHLCQRLVPARRRPDEIDPDLYGAAESLRELAATTGLPEYFQRSDAELYIRVLEQAMLRGVMEFLTAKGYSVATVREVAHTTITNTTNVHGHDFRGANIGNEHNTQHNHGGWPGDGGGGRAG